MSHLYINLNYELQDQDAEIFPPKIFLCQIIRRQIIRRQEGVINYDFCTFKLKILLVVGYV